MRQVDRSTVPVPPNLQQDLSSELARLRKPKAKIKDKIYAHPDVKHSLRLLYLDKCFICEKIVGSGGEVEHFHPWSNNEPERAYDWENLNWSCRSCNGRKKGNEYTHEQAGPQGSSRYTVLINPSSPPFDLTVDELIRFNDDFEAEATSQMPQSEEVKKTVNFLNENDLIQFRWKRWKTITKALFDLASPIDEWRELLGLSDIALSQFDEVTRQRMENALHVADRIFGIFFMEKKEFITCMKYVLFEYLHLTVDELKKLSDAFRDSKGMPHLNN